MKHPTSNIEAGAARCGWLTVQDVAELLQIRPRTVALWVRQGRLPAVRMKRMLRFKASEIDSALLARCRVQTKEEAS
jgi:excisionase family DNA binding protein